MILILSYNKSIANNWHCDIGVHECVDNCNFDADSSTDGQTKLCKLMCTDSSYWCPQYVEIDVD